MISPQTRFYTLHAIVLILLFTAISSRAEWPVEGIEPLPDGYSIDGYIAVADTSSGVWFIFESWNNPSSATSSSQPKLKDSRSVQYSNGYLRIQHIDSSGVKLFGEWGRSVIQDTTDTLAWLHGAVPTSDGGVIVAYMALTQYRDSYGLRTYGIYAQRFSPDGER